MYNRATMPWDGEARMRYDEHEAIEQPRNCCSTFSELMIMVSNKIKEIAVTVHDVRKSQHRRNGESG